MRTRLVNSLGVIMLATVAGSLSVVASCNNDDSSKPNPTPKLLVGQSFVQKGQVLIPEQKLFIDLPAKTTYQWVGSYAKFGLFWWDAYNKRLPWKLIIEVKIAGPSSPHTVDEAVAAHSAGRVTDDLKTGIVDDGWWYTFHDIGWHFAGARRSIGDMAFDCEVLTRSTEEVEIAMAMCNSVRPN